MHQPFEGNHLFSSQCILIQLLRPWRPKKRAQPAGARSIIKRRGPKNIEIDIPASGLFGKQRFLSSSVLLGVDFGLGTFAIAWNAFVLFWSYSAIVSSHLSKIEFEKLLFVGGFLPLLFSIPFWYAGAEITKLSVANCLTHQNLRITPRKFYMTKELSFLKRIRSDKNDEAVSESSRKAKKQIEGKTSDLSRAQVQPSLFRSFA